jgi:heme/copper-type cytochrome/quinol oxidase subunit 2
MTHDTSSKSRSSIPWVWLGLGIVISLVLFGVSAFFLVSFLARQENNPLDEQNLIIIQLTAPPIPTATTSAISAIPTLAPTATSMPTPDFSIAPPQITAGFYAEVVETGGVGVTVRNGPSTSNIPVTVASEGAVVFVIEGPEEGGAYQWWLVRLSDGTEGWAAADFLKPSTAP